MASDFDLQLLVNPSDFSIKLNRAIFSGFSFTITSARPLKAWRSCDGNGAVKSVSIAIVCAPQFLPGPIFQSEAALLCLRATTNPFLSVTFYSNAG